MTTTALTYGLLAGLAIALLVAAVTDLRRRQIDNGLNAVIALAAPLFWWARGLPLWPDAALQLGLALAVFAAMAGLFALKAIGGGDVKLLAALALWLPVGPFLRLIVLTALLGGALAAVCLMARALRPGPGRAQVPYGVAIAAAGLWVLANDGGAAWPLR